MLSSKLKVNLSFMLSSVSNFFFSTKIDFNLCCDLKGRKIAVLISHWKPKWQKIQY